MKKEYTVPVSSFDIKDPSLVHSEDSDTLIVHNINPKTGRPTKLSEVLNFLPAGIIYKAETGMGATTLELQCPRNSIIVEPLRSTAYTKATNPGNRYPAKFVGTEPGGTKGTDSVEIQKYLQETTTFIKFVVVADSLRKVLDAISKKDRPSYHLLLDESDSFQLESTYRDSMEKSLDGYKEFPQNQRSMVTATPLKFSDPELESEPFLTIKYKEPEKRPVTLIETETGLGVLVEQILDHFSGSDEYTKLVVALNHIDDMMKVIETVSNDDNVRHVHISQIRVLCSSSRKDKVGGAYYELKNGSLPTVLTFMTSAYFTGIDINDQFHLITYVSPKTGVVRLSEKRLKQISGRGRNGLFSETIVYDTSMPVDLQTFTPDELLKIAKTQVSALNCIAITYASNPLMKTRMEETFNSLLDIGTVNTSRLVRVKSAGEFLISYLNIDALVESSRVLEKIYLKPGGLEDALANSGCILSSLSKISVTKVVEESTISKKNAARELANIEDMLSKLKSRETSFDELLKVNKLSRLEQKAVNLFGKFRRYLQEDDLMNCIMELTNGKRKADISKNLNRLERVLHHAIEDPTKGFLHHLFQEIPLSPEKGVWYSQEELAKGYHRAALNAGKTVLKNGNPIEMKVLLRDIQDIYHTRAAQKKNGVPGYYISGRAKAHGLETKLNKYFNPEFSAKDFNND